MHSISTEVMIHELRRLHRVHKDDRVDTFSTNWSNLCRDVADRLEELNNEVKRLNGGK